MCGGSGGGGGGASLSAIEEATIIKQTRTRLKGASQNTIKQFAGATERQIQSVGPGYISASAANAKNYQRMVLEYNTARKLIK